MTLDGLERPPRSRRPRRWARRLWREWVRPFLVILVLMGSLRSAVADWNHVPTGSMQPTILIGDRIFVNKLAYDLRLPFTRYRLLRWAHPRRGDLIVFLSPADGKRLVKRVIGLPGDTVEMHHNRLIVNGEPAEYLPFHADVLGELETADLADHAFSQEALDGSIHPIMTSPERPSRHTFSFPQIPAGRYFVMGDNRDESFDSRWFGLVDESLILGRATAVAISVDPHRYYLPRWGRFFTDLP